MPATGISRLPAALQEGSRRKENGGRDEAGRVSVYSSGANPRPLSHHPQIIPPPAPNLGK